MRENRHLLRLADDPVGRTLWLLKDLPLECMVACLELVVEQMEQRGLLSDADRTRIDELLAQIPGLWLDKAA
jgi:hypothetical protein